MKLLLLALAACAAEPTAGAPPPTVPFEIDLTGDAPGSAQLAWPDAGGTSVSAACAAPSCTFAVPATSQVFIHTATTAASVAFTASGGTCAGSGFDCTATAGTTLVVATFHTLPGETDLAPPATVAYTVDYSPANALAVGTDAGVFVYSPALALLWSAPYAGAARINADGEVFVQTTDAVVKLDATGALLWSHPGGHAPPLYDFGVGHQLAVLPGGGVVVNRDLYVELLDNTGALARTMLFDEPYQYCVETRPSGELFVCTDSGLSVSNSYVVREYTPAGDRVEPNFPSHVAFFAPERGSVALGGTQVLGMWLDSFPIAGVSAVGYDRQFRYERYFEDYNLYPPIAPNERIAINESDQGLWVYLPDSDDSSYQRGLHIVALSPMLGIVWEVDRPLDEYEDSIGERTYSGIQMRDAAVSPDGHRTVAGAYFDIAPTTHASVLVFAP